MRVESKGKVIRVERRSDDAGLELTIITPIHTASITLNRNQVLTLCVLLDAYRTTTVSSDDATND